MQGALYLFFIRNLRLFLLFQASVLKLLALGYNTI
jgi:hypothetical protein